MTVHQLSPLTAMIEWLLNAIIVHLLRKPLPPVRHLAYYFHASKTLEYNTCTSSVCGGGGSSADQWQ
jgi:hypothetical protein